QDDGAPARVKPEGKETRVEAGATGWYARLRWLNRILLPRESNRRTREIQDVGGLSLTRVGTIRSLYQLQKAFFTRLHPNGERDFALEGFGDEILQKMERMREQRVKQLASRIAEAALGVGIEQPRKRGKQPKRPTDRIVNPRFAPCHAVVIENLTKYTPDELRTRLEPSIDGLVGRTGKKIPDRSVSTARATPTPGFRTFHVAPGFPHRGARPAMCRGRGSGIPERKILEIGSGTRP